MTTYVYRVTVEAWPTEDGGPWQSFYGYPLPGMGPDEDYPDEPPAWVLAQERNPVVASRFRYDVAGNLEAVTMPRTSSRNYLSGSAASRLVEHLQAFGAVARRERSQPVVF